MNKTKLLFIAILATVISITGCKKEGLGGKGEIKGQTILVSTGKVLKGTTVYIKYGATSSPGTDASNYDDNKPSDSDGKFDFKELRNGNYFLFAKGADGSTNVSGSIQIVLNDDEIKENISIPMAP